MVNAPVPDAARRRWAGALAAAALLAPAARLRAAAGFPHKPVRIVVPYAVGLGPDVVARALASVLTTRWHQPVVIENRPGASGIVAFGEVRRVTPDGHTLFIADSATLAVNPLLLSRLPYDPEHDLEPLTLLFRATFALLTGVPGRFRDLRALLDAARSAPDAVRYATLGHGHPSQMAVELMAREAGVRMLAIPFRDAGPLFAAVAGGDVDFTAFSINSVAGLVASHKLRALAIGARERLPAHPDLPTLAEAGAPAVEMRPWAGLVTVRDTPAPILQQLGDDLRWAIGDAGVRQQADAAGFELLPSSANALRARASADRALYAPLVDEGRVPRMTP